MKRQGGGYRYSRLQLLEGPGIDPYRPSRKPASPLICSGCGATFAKGRWRWGEAPDGARHTRCAACRRSAEGVPAGFITLGGEYFESRRAEILARVRSCEAQEAARHPLARIIGIANDGNGATVTTTSTHLARRIGHALEHAFKGQLTLTYNKQENLLRVRWTRAAG